MNKNAQTRRFFDNLDRLGYAFVIYEIYQLVRHGTSTTFESLPWRSRVVRQFFSNIIALPKQIQDMIQMLWFFSLPLSRLIQVLFITEEAWCMNWA